MNAMQSNTVPAAAPHKLALPAGFAPRKNQLAIVREYGETYFGSFTGVTLQSGSFEVYFRDRAGDARWESTRTVEVSIA